MTPCRLGSTFQNWRDGRAPDLPLTAVRADPPLEMGRTGMSPNHANHGMVDEIAPHRTSSRATLRQLEENPQNARCSRWPMPGGAMRPSPSIAGSRGISGDNPRGFNLDVARSISGIDATESRWGSPSATTEWAFSMSSPMRSGMPCARTVSSSSRRPRFGPILSKSHYSMSPSPSLGTRGTTSAVTLTEREV